VAALQFRDAVAGDVPTIVAMYADDVLGATREDATDSLSASYWEAFEAIDADPRHRLIVVEADGAVVATLQLSFLPCLTHRGGERAQIEAVRVTAERRGSGLGREVFEWTIAEARGRGCRVVQLMTDAQRPDAHRFYASLGFAPTHVGMKLDLL
jgi:GNAT superfamily N-acetyltransferase